MTAQPAPVIAAALDAWAAGDLVTAQRLAMASLEADPEPAAFGILAEILAAHGEGKAATAIYRTGLARFPDNLPLAINFARLLRTLPDGAAEAVAILKRVVNQEPGFAPARLSLIETVRTATGRLDEAERLARGYLVLALILFDGHRLIEADQAADTCLALKGHRERALELKASIRVGLGDAAGVVGCYRDLIRDRPDPAIHSRLLMAMQYCDGMDEAAIFAETESWVRAHTADIVPRTVWPCVDFDPARRLRIGIVSRDFRASALPYLVMPLFRHWPAEWTMTLYANVEQHDDWTAQFRALADHWVDIAELDDDAAADRIAADRIDVLFDINGHTLGGRPGLFARKPAPVQLAWLDYVGTTGLATMDGIIGDAGHLPLSDQRWYVEPILHVAADLYRYEPPSGAPPVAALPALAAGRVSFGCFNSAYKLSASTLSLWARILHALPSSRLILKAPEYGTADTCRRFLALFAQHGIGPARLDLRAGAVHPLGMLAAYEEVDIALDPFPYSGGLTSLEALHMGVPVVTMPGRRFGSRHSAVHLRAIGLDDWIAADDDDYVALALRQAGDPAALAALRATLRPRLDASPLRDGAALAADLARIVRTQWQAACRAAARM
jgi:protein O-GlcNAc transferase